MPVAKQFPTATPIPSPERISLSVCRTFIPHEPTFTDTQIETFRNQAYALADLIISAYQPTKKPKPDYRRILQRVFCRIKAKATQEGVSFSEMNRRLRERRLVKAGAAA